MKMKKEHVAYLKKEIGKLLTNMPDAAVNYERGRFDRAYTVKDLQRRFCFDVLQAAVDINWVVDNLYPYLNDDHVYTALKNICPIVTRKY